MNVITSKVLTRSRQDSFSRSCLGAHFVTVNVTLARKMRISKPNLDPRTRVLHVTVHSFFVLGLKRVQGEPRRWPWGPLGAKVAQKPSPRASGSQFYMIFDFWEDVSKKSARIWDDVFVVACFFYSSLHSCLVPGDQCSKGTQGNPKGIQGGPGRCPGYTTPTGTHERELK